MGNSIEFFLDYMRGLLGDEVFFYRFLTAFGDKPRYHALRVNTSKIDAAEFAKIFRGWLEPNPLCDCSFYCGFDGELKPSTDPLYHAGLYYMQEPSASAAVEALAPFIGERVLDLCAAPGGKATQAAAHMNGGVIFCNDPEYKRVRALVENVERLGVSNAVITCATAADYRRAGFDGYFDTLIVDAPCSGGCMICYEDVPFSRDIIEGCAARQRGILDDAVELLCTGGYMLYSTCTFSVEENERNVEYLLSLGMRTVDIPLRDGEERGVGMPDARRVYPMNFDGEGHFYCVLQKTRDAACNKSTMRKKAVRVRVGGLELDAVEIDKRIILPVDLPETGGLNVVRAGVAVFADGKTPSHALVHALSPEQLRAFGSVELADVELVREERNDGARSELCDEEDVEDLEKRVSAAAEYIRGAELPVQAQKGMLAATVHGYALGLVKSAPSSSGGYVLKNKYPKYLRVQPRKPL